MQRQQKSLIPYLLLTLILISATANHILFFKIDNRPFLDHDFHYFINEFLPTLKWAYPYVSSIAHFFNLDNIAAYKMTHLVFFLPLLIVTFFLAKQFYSDRVAILTTWFMANTPLVLNMYRKSEINTKTMFLFTLSVFFFSKSNFFKRTIPSILFGISLAFLLISHYSGLIYTTIIFILIITSYLYYRPSLKEHYLLNSFFFISFFIGVSAYFFLNNSHSTGFYLWAFKCYGINAPTIWPIICSLEIFKLSFYLLRLIKESCVFYFDPYFYLTILNFCYHFGFIIYSRITKRSIPFPIIACFIVVGCNTFLLAIITKSSGGLKDCHQFFIPVFFFICLLNAVSVDQLFKKLSTLRFGKLISTAIAIVCLSYMLAVYINPKPFIAKTDINLHYFYPETDDFGMSSHLAYLKSIPDIETQLKHIAIYPENPDNSRTQLGGLYFFSLYLELTGKFPPTNTNPSDPSLIIRLNRTDDQKPEQASQIDQTQFTLTKKLPYGFIVQKTNERRYVARFFLKKI